MLPAPHLLIPFLLAVALIEFTPGPNMGYLAIVGSRWGRAAGLATVAGVTAGLAIYLLAAVIGLAEAVVRVRWLYEALRWAGVLYLFWVAVETWRGEAETSPGHARGEPDHRRLFLRGFVANLLNPKAAIFYAVLLPGFIDAGRGSVAIQAVTLGLIHLTISVVVHTTIVLTAAGARPAMLAWEVAGGSGALRKGFAIALGAIALWIAWETRRAALAG